MMIFFCSLCLDDIEGDSFDHYDKERGVNICEKCISKMTKEESGGSNAIEI
jgi:hypothetical protein